MTPLDLYFSLPESAFNSESLNTAEVYKMICGLVSDM